MSIYLTAIIKAKAEHNSTVLHLLKQMVIESRKEKSCIRYDLHQSKDDKNIFIFYEIWKNQEGLDIHNKQPYLQDFMNIIPEKLQEAPAIYVSDII